MRQSLHELVEKAGTGLANRHELIYRISNRFHFREYLNAVALRVKKVLERATCAGALPPAIITHAIDERPDTASRTQTPDSIEIDGRAGLPTLISETFHAYSERNSWQ